MIGLSIKYNRGGSTLNCFKWMDVSRSVEFSNLLIVRTCFNYCHLFVLVVKFCSDIRWRDHGLDGYDKIYYRWNKYQLIPGLYIVWRINDHHQFKIISWVIFSEKSFLSVLSYWNHFASIWIHILTWPSNCMKYGLMLPFSTKYRSMESFLRLPLSLATFVLDQIFQYSICWS